MLKKIVIALVVILAVFLVVVAMQPAEFRVARSTTIAAPPAAVFSQVNELKKWEAWNPWGRLDPAMKLTYSGPASGVGAAYAWSGNNQVGEGRMTITESRPNERVRFNLEFLKPMTGTSEAEFTFKPKDNQTEVTWTMTGKNNFMAKAVCLFMNMDKMVGGSFETGLSTLKTIVETPGRN